MIDDEFGVVIETQRFKELKTFRDIFNEIEKTK
jgi:acyl carrier protein